MAAVSSTDSKKGLCDADEKDQNTATAITTTTSTQTKKMDIKTVKNTCFFAEDPLEELTEAKNKGFDLNQTDWSGWQLIHIATFGGHIRVVDALLKLGVDINSLSTDGHSVIYFAIQYFQYNDCEVKYLKVLDFVLIKGAKFHSPGYYYYALVGKRMYAMQAIEEIYSGKHPEQILCNKLNAYKECVKGESAQDSRYTSVFHDIKCMENGTMPSFAEIDTKAFVALLPRIDELVKKNGIPKHLIDSKHESFPYLDKNQFAILQAHMKKITPA